MPALTWRLDPESIEDESCDEQHLLSVDGKETGFFVQDTRAYCGGKWMTGQHFFEGDEIVAAAHHATGYRSLKAAKAAMENLFRSAPADMPSLA